MSVPNSIIIDPDRVERLVLELARFGASGDTGVGRPVYTSEWVRSDCRLLASIADLCHGALA